MPMPTAMLAIATAPTAGIVSFLAIVHGMLMLGAEEHELRERWFRALEEGWIEMNESLPAEATLEQTIGKIRRAQLVTSAYVGYSGSSSPVYDAYIRLGQVASDRQLRALAEDQEPAVRVYTFWALSNRQLGGVAYDVLLAHANDDGRVRTQYGCIGSEQAVFELMLEHVEHRLSKAQLADVHALRARTKLAEPAPPTAGFVRKR